MRQVFFKLALLVLVPVVTATAWAHHSVSGEFDARDAKLYKITGTLTELDWINPHIYFTLEVKDAAGKATAYHFENYPPSFWKRQGVNKSAFKVGETLTVEAYPARDGTKNLGWAKIIHFPDSRSIATMTAEDAATAR